MTKCVRHCPSIRVDSTHTCDLWYSGDNSVMLIGLDKQTLLEIALTNQSINGNTKAVQYEDFKFISIAQLVQFMCPFTVMRFLRLRQPAGVKKIALQPMDDISNLLLSIEPSNGHVLLKKDLDLRNFGQFGEYALQLSTASESWVRDCKWWISRMVACRYIFTLFGYTLLSNLLW